ncbi:metal-sulfur cluster assembly factor [Sphingobacterium sp.]|uniref:metal-sulfur cluster assembly factor n=1 Tax=Sphingobacterium sp. TaxID=341027 RepID=UPI0028A0378B|nr:metal-sulfur cluster assembly factor [Sphingobacterium sp.]
MKIDLTKSDTFERLKAVQALMLIMDPELGINIVDMGLIYDLDLNDPGRITVTMTLSSAYCPMGDAIVNGVENTLQCIFPHKVVHIDLVWDPIWTPDRITEEGKRLLNNE